MTGEMGKRGPKDRGPKAPKVVRRRRDERKSLPADLEAFAGGDDDAIWRRPAKRRLRDPRPVLLVPGVANRDARSVYEIRLQRTLAARDAGDDELLAIELAEAARLAVWRGHSVVGWEVFVEEILQLEPERAIELRDRGAETVGSAELAPEPLIATWMRAEAGMIEALGPTAAVRLVGEHLRFEIPHDRAPMALAAMGRRAAPLAREQAEAPDSIVHRPKGVPPLSVAIAREQGPTEE